MSVKHALLGILSEKERHGYELKSAFDERIGERAVAMAVRLSDRISALPRQWPPLGVGVGVASGAVTVGAIGGEARLEYAAVGRAVNLATRLCARADAGQVLVDERVAASAPESGRFERLEAVELKGFSAPVPVFSLHAEAFEAGTG